MKGTPRPAAQRAIIPSIDPVREIRLVFSLVDRIRGGGFIMRSGFRRLSAGLIKAPKDKSRSARTTWEHGPEGAKGREQGIADLSGLPVSRIRVKPAHIWAGALSRLRAEPRNHVWTASVYPSPARFHRDKLS
jgi:hypothetical protein